MIESYWGNIHICQTEPYEAALYHHRSRPNLIVCFFPSLSCRVQMVTEEPHLSVFHENNMLQLYCTHWRWNCYGCWHRSCPQRYCSENRVPKGKTHVSRHKSFFEAPTTPRHKLWRNLEISASTPSKVPTLQIHPKE